jgi:hypothetical protein
MVGSLTHFHWDEGEFSGKVEEAAEERLCPVTNGLSAMGFGGVNWTAGVQNGL